jgi:hypothetical protein
MNIRGNRLGGLIRGYVANLFCDFSEAIIAEGAITLSVAAADACGVSLVALSLNLVYRHEPTF